MCINTEISEGNLVVQKYCKLKWKTQQTWHNHLWFKIVLKWMWGLTPVIQALGKLRQEAGGVEGSLGYRVRTYLKNQTNASPQHTHTKNTQ